ncbi:MAG: hypothetical protein AB7S75_03890 [Desulfococcaceae bacterium]
MNKHTSTILRIGLINSGMFDILELETDVEAIHLIGPNNVGKTSLIEMIQFLYFHNVSEMTFSKSSSESLVFYFRPEGSYILFEVHTVHRTRRTVGIFGTGSADSREIFVFDGSFRLDDFLDDSSHVLPLQQAQSRLFQKNFRKYQKIDQYEKALLGLHSESELNVQMFDLSQPNFRMLRRLMKGLLRLDRLNTSQVSEFIIAMVEKSGVKTRINIVTDYERKNRNITDTKMELDRLMTLEPVIKKWQEINEEIKMRKQQIEEDVERFFHLSSHYLHILNQKKLERQAEYNNAKRKTEHLSEQNKELVKKETESKLDLTEVNQAIHLFDELNEICSRFDRIHTREEQDQLTRKKIELEEILAQIKPENADTLRNQLKHRRNAQKRIQRQMEKLTLDQIWIKGELSGEHISLLRFLLSQNLISLPVSDVLTDEAQFLKTSRQVAEHINDDGIFRGFGLSIPKSEWYVPKEETETLEAQMERISKEIIELEHKMEVAENREKKQNDLQELLKNIHEKEKILRKFDALDQWKNNFENWEKCEERQRMLKSDLGNISENIQKIREAMNQILNQCEKLYNDLDIIGKNIENINEDIQVIKTFSSECPSAIQNLSETDTYSKYCQIKSRVKKNEEDLRRLEEYLNKHRIILESHYDRESPDETFEEWNKKNQKITEQIEKFKGQLREDYKSLFKTIMSELDKLTQAFEAVRDRITSLNRNIKNVSISNIERIELNVEESNILAAVRKTCQMQTDIFLKDNNELSSEQAQQFVNDYLGKLMNYGREFDLKNMFQLEFRVRFSHSSKPVHTHEIHKFESHGTETGIKIIIYLGLISLLQEYRQALSARIPFFLDEVGSIDSQNLKQLIRYCTENNFLPIFASPDIRNEIHRSYFFQRNGDRSELINKCFLTANEAFSDETSQMDSATA